MSGGYFSDDSARRISNSVRYTELLQGIPDASQGYAANPGGQVCLVRTGTALPSGYTGSMAVLGDVIERQSDGTDLAIGQVWIADVNGGSLAANTTYQARMAGTFSQALTINGLTTPTTLGFYLVQAGGAATASGGWQLHEYRGSSLSSVMLTLVNLETGLTTTLLANPLGMDAVGLNPMFGVIPRMMVKPMAGGVQLYNVTPFSFWAKATSVVDDGYGNDIAYLATPFVGGIGSTTFRAKDPTKAVRANYSRYGILPMVHVTWSPVNYPFSTPANQFPYIITAAEVNTPIGGIGTGISAGISGA